MRAFSPNASRRKVRVQSCSARHRLREKQPGRVIRPARSVKPVCRAVTSLPCALSGGMTGAAVSCLRQRGRQFAEDCDAPAKAKPLGREDTPECRWRLRARYSHPGSRNAEAPQQRHFRALVRRSAIFQIPGAPVAPIERDKSHPHRGRRGRSLCFCSPQPTCGSFFHPSKKDHLQKRVHDEENFNIW